MSENSVAPKTYRPNIKALRERAKQAGESKYWKIPVGISRFRILPAWDPNDEVRTFTVDQVLHYRFKKDGSDIALPCLAAMWGEPCPACILHGWIDKNSDKELAKEMRPQVKAYYNIVLRPANELKIWSVGPQRRDEIFSLLDTEDYADCLDPEKGRDWILTREGTGKNDTRYPSFMPAPNPSPIGVDGWQSLLTDLRKEFVDSKKMTREEAIKIIYGTYAALYPLDEILA